MEIVNQWAISPHKFIRLFGRQGKLAFRRMTPNDVHHCSRGVTLTQQAFHRMDDVSITPTARVNLDERVILTNYGRHIQVTKYCYSFDNKQCDGGIFFFTPSEWQYFWTKIYPKIVDRIKE